MFLIRHRLTARIVAFFLQSNSVCWVLSPLWKQHFLSTLFNHPRSVQAFTTLLRTNTIERGVAHLLRHDAAFAAVSREDKAEEIVGKLVGTEGLGVFFRNFVMKTDPRVIMGFLRHRSTAKLVATVVRAKIQLDSLVDWLKEDTEAVAAAVARICKQPGAEVWATDFCHSEGMERWLGGMLAHPRGAFFAHRVLMEPGFAARVNAFLAFEESKAFVIRLILMPGVRDFVTWVNKDPAMHWWFAQIASLEATQLFITEMLLEPGLDRFIVNLLLETGNGKAFRSMLDYWIHTEGSFDTVLGSFAQKPGVAKALARVIMSKGFMDRFFFGNFLWQEGMRELTVEALLLVGFRGLKETILPLTLGIAGAVILFSAYNLMDSAAVSDVDVSAITAMVEEASFADFLPFLLPFL